ncbi:GDP-fucose protein O-fucosyltransferase [Fennellomyces sp. T-0311]|nr:GDP-fucose protein O-fucosyltransferase [Fennellomyces sp. T-0311]
MDVNWQAWLPRPPVWTHRDPSTTPEKFLTFLPHSGLHNQRIALINAAILAKALDRTLLMPELNLGTATFWRPSNELGDRLAHCPDSTLPAATCYDYRNYVPVPVDEIFDLTAFHSLGVRTMKRHDMHEDYFLRYWGVDETNVDQMMYILDDDKRYSYQIHDELSSHNASLQQFARRIDMEDLAQRPEPFIMFGSLFGSRRLAISRPDLVEAREYLRREMGVSHPVVLDKADAITARLGGPNQYLSVHIRQGDGIFKKSSKKTIEQIQKTLERYAPHDDNEDGIVADLQRLDDRPERLKECVKLQGKHKHPSLRLIYMATDAEQPREKFTDLYDEFKCLFTLHDFPDVVQSLRDTVADPYLRDGALLLPLVDAEVAALADHFVPTPKSTFSGYIRQRNSRFHKQL